MKERPLTRNSRITVLAALTAALREASEHLAQLKDTSPYPEREKDLAFWSERIADYEDAYAQILAL